MRTCVVIIMVLITSVSISQKTVRVTYALQRNFPDSFFNKFPEDSRDNVKAEFSKPLYRVVTNNGMQSLAESMNGKDIKIPLKELQAENTINEGIRIPSIKSWKLKNFSDQSQTTLVTLQDKKYYLKKSLVKPKIVFIKGEVTIDNYKCNKAYSIDQNKSNDTITYWYTTDIALDDGPTDEIGFPGLVLKRQTKYGVEYATKIEFFDTKLELEQPNKNIPEITDEEYKKLNDAFQTPKNYTDERGRKIETKVIKLNTE